MEYIITLFVCLALYTVGCVFLHRIPLRKEVVNVVFVVAIFVPYVYCVIAMYLDVGAHDWNFTNTLPTANVSPFTYCLAVISLFLPKKLQPYLFNLFALLSFGMVCAGSLSCISFALRRYAFHLTIAFDCLSHVLVSLWGVYLVKSGQAELSVKKSIQSGAIIVAVAIGMLLTNLAFDTAFFGLSLTGKHNIYNFVLCESGTWSAILYFIGLHVVLFVGYFYQRLLQGKRRKSPLQP